MPKKFWIGLVVIMILYTIYQFLYVETNYLHENIDRRMRHIIAFGILIAVYLVGAFCLKNKEANWMKIVWNFIYIIGVTGLILLGLYDWMIKEFSLNAKLTLRNVNDFLVSPILYIGIGILSKLFVQKNIVDNVTKD